MFEDEGSLRRRPRGFRRKQQMKSYSSPGSFYPPPSQYDAPQLNVSEIPNCYPTSYATYTHEYPSSSIQPPPPPPTFTSDAPWQYQSEYIRNPSPPQHVPPHQNVLDYGSSYHQSYQELYENGGNYFCHILIIH